MSLIARTTSCVFRCTKRMINDSCGYVPPVKKVYHKVFNVQAIQATDILINRKLQNNEEIADDQWVEIRKELLEILKSRRTSDTILDSLIYDLCAEYGRINRAKDYFKFLERNNYNVSLSILGRYLRILITNKEITEAEEQEIFRICSYIKEKYPVLDPKTSTDFIRALVLTKRWNEAFEMLDMLRYADVPGLKVISELCGAAFRNDKPEKAWELMNEFITKFPMDHDLYLDYLEYCKRNFKNKNLVNEIEKMFNFWRENEVIVVDFVMEKYMEALSTVGYKTSFASIPDDRQCSKCNSALKETTLTADEFRTLSTAVLKNVIIGKDVYHATSPQELKRYMLFIKTLQPYDVIIDGLNVSYSTVDRHRRGSLNNILEVVNMFGKKRVLVIGRAHMRWWSVETMKKIEQKAEVFLLKNLSEDDPFLLHLCLVSGPQTYFVSRDKMRQHKHKLEMDNLKKLFRRWQLSRQYISTSDKSKRIKLVRPVPVELTAQKMDSGWHIPCTRNPILPLPLLYSTSELWACLMKKKVVKKKE